MQHFVIPQVWLTMENTLHIRVKMRRKPSSSLALGYLQDILSSRLESCQPYPDSKVHGTNTGPTWGRQDPGGPHVGPMNLAIWATSQRPNTSFVNSPPQILHITYEDLYLHIRLSPWLNLRSFENRSDLLGLTQWNVTLNNINYNDITETVWIINDSMKNGRPETGTKDRDKKLPPMVYVGCTYVFLPFTPVSDTTVLKLPHPLIIPSSLLR